MLCHTTVLLHTKPWQLLTSIHHSGQQQHLQADRNACRGTQYVSASCFRSGPPHAALLLVLPLSLLMLLPLLPLLPTPPDAVAGLHRSSFNLTWLIRVGGCGLGKAWESRRPVLILSSVLAVPFMLLLLFCASLGPAMLPAARL
jgi:hypothetical protein